MVSPELALPLVSPELPRQSVLYLFLSAFSLCDIGQCFRLREAFMLNAMQADHVAAHHEAGHAVGAFLLGVPFEKVALASPGSGEGHIPGSLTVKEIRESNLCWEHAVVARLGPETEKLFFGRADRRYYQNDVVGPIRDLESVLSMKTETLGAGEGGAGR